MSLPLLMAGVTALTFLWRLAGLSLNVPRLSPFWANFFRFLPIAIFAALTVSPLYKDTSVLNLKMIALVIAGVLAWQTRKFGLSVLCGLLILWVFVWLGAK